MQDQPDHRDRCWLSVDEKRVRREVMPGEFGLTSKEHTPA
jgi:hypothetical protein